MSTPRPTALPTPSHCLGPALLELQRALQRVSHLAAVRVGAVVVALVGSDQVIAIQSLKKSAASASRTVAASDPDRIREGVVGRRPPQVEAAQDVVGMSSISSRRWEARKSTQLPPGGDPDISAILVHTVVTAIPWRLETEDGLVSSEAMETRDKLRRGSLACSALVGHLQRLGQGSPLGRRGFSEGLLLLTEGPTVTAAGRRTLGRSGRSRLRRFGGNGCSLFLRGDSNPAADRGVSSPRLSSSLERGTLWLSRNP